MLEGNGFNVAQAEETVSCRIRAAEYIRMSTEHQQYSTENQAEAIRQYAEQRNMEIVRTYADDLRAERRVSDLPAVP